MQGEITLSRNERHFLRRRYGKRYGDKRLVLMAVQEAIRDEAKKFLAEDGYAPVEDAAGGGNGMNNVQVGDTVTRCWPGLREKVERHEGDVTEVTPEYIAVCINIDTPRTMRFSPVTGVNVNGRQYGWLEVTE